MVMDWLTVMLQEYCTGYVGECKGTACSQKKTRQTCYSWQLMRSFARMSQGRKALGRSEKAL